MRIRTMFVLLAFLITPLVADAAVTAPTAVPPPLVCKGGLVGDPMGSKVFTISATVAAEVQAYMQQVTCANACFDENIDFAVSVTDQSLKVTVATQNKCAKTKEDPKGLDPVKNNRGCAKGQTTPSATMVTPAINVPFVLKIPSRSIGPKNRCDVALLTNLSSMMKALAGGGIPKEEDVKVALDNLDENTSGPSTGPLDSGANAALSSALQNSLGLDAGKADDLAANNPDSAQKMLDAYAKGDVKTLTDEAKNADVTLNEDVLKKFATLTDAERAAEVARVTSNDSSNIPPTTGFGAPGSEKLTIDAKGPPSAPVLPGNKIDPGVLGAVAADAQRRVCAQVRGTCYVTTEAQFATMMNETPGNVRLYGDGGKSASLAQVYEPTANSLLGKYKALYGEDYALNRIDIRDTSINPEWVASQSLRMQALVLQEKGQQTGGNFGRQLAAYNGGGSAAAAYGVRALGNANLLQNGNATGYWQSAYNAARGAVAGGPTITNLSGNVGAGGTVPGSPLAGASPFGGGSSNPLNNIISSLFGGGQSSQQYGSSPTSGSGGGGSSSGTSGGGGQQQPAPQPAPQPTPSPAAQGTVQTIQPVMAIIVQPKEVVRGNPITISWSTVGTSRNAPCQVFMRSANTSVLIGQGNEGSQRVETNTLMAAGIWNFGLQCTALSGSILTEQATSVSIK